jgi:hypothetical protein
MALAVLGLAWSVFYFAQMGVTTSNEGIVIRNWFRRKSILWPEVQEFKFGNNINNLSVREGLASPHLQTYVITTDGHHYLMCGLTATRVNRSESRRRVQELLVQLEEERRCHH